MTEAELLVEIQFLRELVNKQQAIIDSVDVYLDGCSDINN